MSKYLFVIPTLSKGGAERVVAVLSSAIADKGETAVVVKYYETNGEYPISGKVKMINLVEGDINCYNKISKIKRIALLREVIKKEKPDYIIPFLFLVTLCTEIAAIGIKTNVYKTVRIDPASGPKARWQRILRDHFVKKSKCTFVQNESQKNYFPPKYHDKIHVLFNPVSNDFFEYCPQFRRDPFTVVGIGRLSEQKNYKLLIDGFTMAVGSVDNVILRIYGEGPQKEELERYIEFLNMSDKIKLMGRTNDLKPVLENADLYVLSSDFEGMPNALIEAMAAGIPCISTDCPTGPSELIENNVSGILVPLNDVNALASAILMIYKKELDIKNMTRSARERIDDLCSAGKIAERMISICENSVEYRGI